MAEDKKTDNAHLNAKLNLRRHFLQRYGGPHHVLDCCQGSGALWSTLKREFSPASYWGVDLRHKKGRMKIDSLELLRQPVIRANVIDVDTYGSPWKHWEALCERVTQPTTVFLTWSRVGQSVDGVLARAVGLDRLQTTPPKTCFSFIEEWAVPFMLGIALQRHAVTECKRAELSGKGVRLFGVRLDPRKKN